MPQLRGGCSAAFGTNVAEGGEALALVAEVAQPSEVDLESLAAEIRRCVAAGHGVSLATVRLLRPRYGAMLLAACRVLRPEFGSWNSGHTRPSGRFYWH